MSGLTFNALLEINQGADSSIGWVWAIDGTPVNLTGCSAKLQLRRSANAAVLLECSTANALIVLGGVDGSIRVKLLAAATAALSGQGYWDLLLTQTNGTVTRLIEGAFTVYQRITQ